MDKEAHRNTHITEESSSSLPTARSQQATSRTNATTNIAPRPRNLSHLKTTLPNHIPKMHPHLHTPASSPCDALADALEECHERGFLWKCIGGCTTQKTELNRCLRAARLERQRLNREKAKENREKYERKWREEGESTIQRGSVGKIGEAEKVEQA